MPARADIQKQIIQQKNQSQDIVRRRYLKQLHSQTKRDTVLYASGWTSAQKYPNPPQALYSLSVQDMQGFMAALHELKGDSLDLILHSPGGSLDAADQVVQYLRSKYGHIRAIVPQNAMSAATMLACACDEIVMGKHSAIGPIDPQITFPTQHGMFTAPAQCLLDDFIQAQNEVTANPKLAALWATKIRDYPPGILKICQNTLQLATEKVGDWLETYMLKDADKGSEKARKIAAWLGNANEHKTHGRPIGIQKAREIGLNVTALEDDDALQERVLSVFHSMVVTFDLTNCIKAIENHKGKGSFVQIDIKEAK